MTLRVLVVDDNPDHRFLTRRALARLAPRVEVMLVDGGEAALAAAWGTKPPGLVLLDVKMPGMDGFEVLRRLRADERTKGLAVVMFTSSESDLDHARGTQLGATSFVTKPLDPVAFAEAARKAVEAFL